jgi:riboflavin transporter FmnP
MLSGTLFMTLIGCLMNYYIMIPFYVNVADYPLPAIIAGAKEVGNTLVKDLPTLIVFVFAPFNLFKGIVVSFIVAVIYKRISPLLHKEFSRSQNAPGESIENNSKDQK